jgi:hypothetical protein
VDSHFRKEVLNHLVDEAVVTDEAALVLRRVVAIRTLEHVALIKNVVLFRDVHKCRHGLRVREYQGCCDKSNKALVLNSITMGEGGVKNYEKIA